MFDSLKLFDECKKKKKIMKLFDECLMNIRSLKLRVRNFFLEQIRSSEYIRGGLLRFRARLRRGGLLGRLYILYIKLLLIP